MDLVLRATLMYVAVFAFTRLLGRRELSQMQPFDLILLVVIIEDGRFIEDNLKRERLTVDDVTEEMRLSSIASLEDVRWAVLETSGRLSFVRKEA